MLNLQSVSGGAIALSSESVPGSVNNSQHVIRRFLSADGTAGPVGSFGEVQAMLPEVMDVLSTGSGQLVVGEVRSPQYYSGARSAVAAPLTTGYTWGQPSRLLSQGIPEQQACAIACRGTDYLVVWQDGRNGHTLASEIRGRFFALDGTPSGASFLISNKTTDDISPSVAASGGKYLVAWCVNDSFNGNDDVWAAFVNGAGNVSAAFPVAAMEDRQENGVSVGGGPNGGFFLAWRSGSLDILQPQYDDIYGTWVTSDGTVTAPNGFTVSASPGKERAVSVAGGAGTYGVVWREGGSHHSDVYGAILPGNPVAVPASPQRLNFTGNSNAHAPEIAWNGSLSQYRVVWRDEVGGYHIQTATLSEAGEVGPAGGLAAGTQPLFEPAVVSRAGGWQVFWHETVTRTDYSFSMGNEYRVAFASLDAAGQVTNSDGFAPRFIDLNTLVAASALDGGVLILYPTAEDLGKEIPRTGRLETVLFYPNRPAVDPQVAMTAGASFTTLRWKADPWFPRDAGVPESGTDLLQWKPVLQSPLALQAGGTGEEAVLTLPTLPGMRRFFRLNSSIPGPP